MQQANIDTSLGQSSEPGSSASGQHKTLPLQKQKVSLTTETISFTDYSGGKEKSNVRQDALCLILQGTKKPSTINSYSLSELHKSDTPKGLYTSVPQG